MERRKINRNIAVSKNLRLNYGDCRTFKVLEINITFEGKVYTYEVDAVHLSTDRDSIHAKPTIENGELKLQFTGWVAPYVRFISCH